MAPHAPLLARPRRGGSWRNRLFWLGFGAAVGVPWAVMALAVFG